MPNPPFITTVPVLELYESTVPFPKDAVPPILILPFSPIPPFTTSAPV